MKKFLTLIIALTLMLTSVALAENVPTPNFGTRTEPEKTETVQETAAAENEAEAEPAAEEKTKVSAVEYSVPSGQRTFPYSMVEDGLLGFMIREWQFEDEAQAEEPAENSLKYTALPGTKLLHIRYVFRFTGKNYGYKMPVNSILGVVVDGKQQEYMTTAFIEGSENTISDKSCEHKTVECNSHSNNYMMQISGSDKGLECDWVADEFALCDFIAEIPESIVGTDMPLYLTIKVNESEYYIQIQ